MAVNPYFTQGTRNEQYLIEDLIIESLKIYGQQMFYIPRTLISKDEILGEDRLSQFKSLFPIEMYFENVDSFDGQGAFIQKFGLMMEQSATLVVSRRRWDQLVGRFDATTLPQRPNEGDLIYFPLTKGLFEIKFVKHQDPFYQLGKLYVYKLQVELFPYASEKINTGTPEVDVFETLKSFDVDIIKNGVVSKVDVIQSGNGFLVAPTVLFGRSWQSNIVLAEGTEICHENRRYRVVQSGTLGTTPPTHTSGVVVNGTTKLKYDGSRATGTAILGNGDAVQMIMRVAVTNGGSGYSEAPKIYLENAGSGIGFAAVAYIENADTPQSYGDNEKFKDEASDIIFNESNPRGAL